MLLDNKHKNEAPCRLINASLWQTPSLPRPVVADTSLRQVVCSVHLGKLQTKRPGPL